MTQDSRKCQRCAGHLPAGSRADRKWCSPACQRQAFRRSSGAVVENGRSCSSCGGSLAGLYANARVCRSLKCRTWATRHPGVPHPSTQTRVCGHCAASIDHLNGKAKYCGKACRNAAIMVADRDAYNARQRRWQSTDRGRAQRRTYQQVNVEDRRRWARDARERDPERYSAYWKRWAAANPDAVATNSHRRRARKLGNPDSVGLSPRDWQRMLRRYRFCCAYCGKRAAKLHREHVVPLAKGGRDAEGNIVPACRKCNLTKHAMLLVVWRYRRRRGVLI